jgi:hypothetical protein
MLEHEKIDCIDRSDAGGFMKEEKKFDAVEVMRKARAQLSEEYRKTPREEFLKKLREKYGQLVHGDSNTYSAR